MFVIYKISGEIPACFCRAAQQHSSTRISEHPEPRKEPLASLFPFSPSCLLIAGGCLAREGAFVGLGIRPRYPFAVPYGTAYRYFVFCFHYIFFNIQHFRRVSGGGTVFACLVHWRSTGEQQRREVMGFSSIYISSPSGLPGPNLTESNPGGCGTWPCFCLYWPLPVVGVLGSTRDLLWGRGELSPGGGGQEGDGVAGTKNWGG
ncbi:hypothetical protein QBC33DRAFT_28165 [Phialemonium atrogriseum]|uniref:Uncharacterized protein n=1 Tax=Phialemonium atrogriseum TaxID=1093897 RepID=A0AAJ0CCF5_9PEZI|nr:uncharacterized protein QBC33DRAFT_28165 [Phialemonium atrogriseum]KAK1772717.1 hypothetical protein QBC33DRAFT_28165 [Phialemonium atrogriseum]